MLMLDKTDIRPSGMSQIEPCDLLGRDGTLCHVKRHTTATGISHLANQGVASATVLLRRAESRDKLAGLIEDRAWDPSSKRHVQEDLGRMATTQTRLPVSFAIIGEWTNPAIRNLSLLSRIALRTATQKLTDLGFPAQIMLIGREPN